jgi:hypothetical protein
MIVDVKGNFQKNILCPVAWLEGDGACLLLCAPRDRGQDALRTAGKMPALRSGVTVIYKREESLVNAWVIA